MITRAPFAVIVAWLSLAVCVPALAQSHAHHADAASSRGAPATRWKTDPALREGMRRIHSEVLGLEHYQHGHIGPQQALVLVDDIERDVRFVLSHCKLAPKADAALHPILEELMRGAQAIRSDPAKLAAIAPMRRALQRYPVLFDDPAWPVGD